MAAVAPQHQQPMPAHTAHSSPAPMEDYSRDASTSDSSLAAPPPPPAPAAPPAPANGKKKGRTKNANNPDDAHALLLSKISQLEADTHSNQVEDQAIAAEVSKANRDLTSLLNTLDDKSSRVDAIQKKYSELLADMKKVEREHQKAKKRGDQLQKEKDGLSSDVRRERGLKEKLEKLSRELTRENKKLKEDLKELKETSADRNEELHRKLESMVLDMAPLVSHSSSTLPHAHSSAHSAPETPQDRLFREKFKSFLEQYEMREIQFQSMLRTKELEVQYQIARHEALKKAQETELSKSHQLTRQVSTFSQTENELRSQLNIYVEKFKQVEDTLNNSNDLFLTFRKEMEEMSKKTKRLEKENLNLTRKQEATNKNIFQMAEERSQSQQTIDKLSKENEKLKKLCRAMQTNGYGAGGAGGAQAQPGAEPDVEGEEEAGTDSEYDEYDEDDEGEYDEDTEEEAIEVRPRTYGPVPPPPPPAVPQDAPNGKVKGRHGPPPQQQQQPQANGVNGSRH